MIDIGDARDVQAGSTFHSYCVIDVVSSALLGFSRLGFYLLQFRMVD
jgi:hypothetical protein